jgi:hypothetical protein
MTLRPEDWPRLKEVFEGARALQADARPAYVTAACGSDEALRHEVETLLASHERAQSFSGTAGWAWSTRPTTRGSTAVSRSR